MVANILGRIFAGRMRLNAQNTVTRITREITKITKQIGRAEKQANAQKRAAQQSVRQQQSIFSQQNLTSNAITALKSDDACKAFFKEDGSFDFNNQAAYMKLNEHVSQERMQVSNWVEAQMAEIDQQYEEYVSMMIEPLKDEQSDLEAEKVVAENEVKEYEGMEQVQKQYADGNIKNMFQVT